MLDSIAKKLTEYNPQYHHIAIYTPTADLACWLAERFQVDRRKWFYVKSIDDLFGRRDLFLLFYGDFFKRDDFDEVWNYWQNFMPPESHYHVLEQDIGEDNG